MPEALDKIINTSIMPTEIDSTLKTNG